MHRKHLSGYLKAFNSVCHEHLLKKFYGNGISSEVCEKIEMFLMDRGKRVTFNIVKSARSPVTSGIPQGMYLDLFLVIFINDMSDGIQNCIQMSADDSKLYTSISNEEDGRALQNNKWSMKISHMSSRFSLMTKM